MSRAAPLLRQGLLLLVLAVTALPGQATALDAPGFAAFAGPGEGRLMLRLDSLPAGPGTAFRVEADTGAGIAELPPPYVQTSRGYALDVSGAAPRQLRLRLVRIADGRETRGPWSSWEDVAEPGSARPRRPAALGAQDWDVSTDPERSNTLLVTVRHPPRTGGAPLQGYRVRIGFNDVGLLLPPETAALLSVSLDAVQIDPGVPVPVYLAAVTAGGTAPWSPPKTAEGAWTGPPRAPAAFAPNSWLVRPGDYDDAARVEIRNLPYAYGSEPGVPEYRIAPAGDLLDPAPDWGLWTPAQPTAFDLRGLVPGRRYMVQLRLQSSSGPGDPGVPKLVTPRALPSPEHAVLGDLNPAGTGRIRLPKGARLAGPADQARNWRVEEGPGGRDYLVPLRDARNLGLPARLEFTGGHTVEVALAADSFAVETPKDLARAFTLGPARLSGARLLIGAEWIDTTAEPELFRGALVGLGAPLSVLPREPEFGTLISRFALQTTRRGQVAGHVRFENLDFYLPEALVSQGGRVRQVNVLDMVQGPGRAESIAIKGVTIRSDVMPARMGYSSKTLIRGIDLTGAADSWVTDNDLGFLSYGLATGGRRSLVRGNRLHHILGDPVNIYFRPGTSAAPTRLEDIVIENNTQSDYIGDGYGIHGDAIHMWMIGAGKAPDRVAISGLRYRGNVSFPGEEGVRAPPVISPLFKVRMARGDAGLEPSEDGTYLRVEPREGPATVRLPPAAESFSMKQGLAGGMQVAVQKAGTGQQPLRILAAGGDRIGGDRTELVLRQPWEAVILTAQTGRDGSPAGWTVRGTAPAYQGFFADSNDVPLSDTVIEGNILWGMAPNQIMPRNRPQDGVYVHHNSLPTPFPGDLNGDGQYNSRGDGTMLFSNVITLAAWDGRVGIWANLASNVVTAEGAPGQVPAAWNNGRLDWSDPAALHAAFPASRLGREGDPASLIWMPRSREEAIALARPTAGSTFAIQSQGALGPEPELDWWDFAAGQRRAGAGTGGTSRLSPADGDRHVPERLPALSIAFDAPLAPGSGTAELRRSGTGAPVQSWRLDPQGEARFPGAELQLPLAAPLVPGTEYEVRLPAGGFTTIFGTRIPAPVSWRFAADAAARVNLLPSADPRADYWNSPGWAPLGSGGPAAFLAPAGSGLRLDSRSWPGFLAPGPVTLGFDYGTPHGPAPSVVTRLREFDGFSLAVDWDRISVLRDVTVAPGVTARKRDAGALYGLPPGRVFRAELSWTMPPGLERVLADLAVGLPEGALMGRLMLSRGGPPAVWSAP
ncbi:Ig-like domain-containing protein [Mangrovicoccus sp. HB161399]|uniref:Ig-like domain-containing protein n=1 Tax=Mangrovicoccus sp. HB161399 TaxID=2720392 RepID=UPI0015572FD0|nr:Ig-like domain-containing protein [Mangrovicoccus sp. HB161399]